LEDPDEPIHKPPYADLTPDVVLEAVDSLGRRTSGTLLALNSYENRVYQVGLEDGGFVVAKFYRPGRWTDEQIHEEHAFTRELAEREIPVVAPLASDDGRTLFVHAGYRYAVFPRRGGRAPELDDPEHLRWLGRFLGRIHAVGAIKAFEHRPTLDVASFGHASYRYLTEHGFVPAEVSHNFGQAAEQVLALVEDAFAAVGPLRRLRLLGDCHPGNILWTEQGPHFVDLDDARMGPAVQDLWMLISGSPEAMGLQMRAILDGYREFFEFDPLELRLIEPLRALRILHYAAWLARRWHDPAFPRHFPWFNTPRYWEEQLNTLRELAERLLDPACEITVKSL